MNFKVKHCSTRGLDNEKEAGGGERSSLRWYTLLIKINPTTTMYQPLHIVYVSFI